MNASMPSSGRSTDCGRWHDLNNRWQSHLGYASILEEMLRRGEVVAPVVAEGIPGTGYGSGSVLGDIEALGGRFLIDSWPGRGTMALITIPAASLFMDEEGKRPPAQGTAAISDGGAFGDIVMAGGAEAYEALVPGIDGDDVEEWGILPGAAGVMFGDEPTEFYARCMSLVPTWAPVLR